MDFTSLDLTKLTEDDLIELNQRIVERLQILRSAKSLAQLARFSVGMVVEFDTEDGRTISGTVSSGTTTARLASSLDFRVTRIPVDPRTAPRTH